MGFGIVWALLAALCMGLATVMQALGARRAAAESPGAGVGVLVGAVRQAPFVVGFGLDILGFAAELVALRSLALFVVEAAIASSLAVTAVAAARLLHIRLRRAEWIAVIMVCCGLAVLALAAGREGDADGDETLRLATLCASVGLALLGWATQRLVRRNRAAVLGLVSGVSFGVVAVSVRMLPGFGLPGLLTEPTVYAVVVSGISGFLYLVQALQSGAVTAATAAMVIGETVGPSVFGVVWLGDDTRQGLGAAAVGGFVLSIAGALVLARFGDVEQHDDPSGTARTV
jgi:hypothetical protein